MPNIDPQAIVQGGALLVLVLILYGGYRIGRPILNKVVDRFLEMSSFNEELTKSTIAANQRIAESATAALQETTNTLQALTSSIEANRKASRKEHSELLAELRGLGGQLGSKSAGN